MSTPRSCLSQKNETHKRPARHSSLSGRFFHPQPSQQGENNSKRQISLQKRKSDNDTHKTVHRSKAIWGNDADEFRPERWLTVNKKQKKAFILFGCGKHLCPGRDFAFVETLGTVAVFLLGFEIMEVIGECLGISRGRMAEYGVGSPDAEGRALKVRTVT